MLGINISEQCHIVNVLPPIDSDDAKTGAVINMENYAHASIIIQVGASDADGGFATLEESDTSAFTNHPEVAFYYYAEETASGDVLDAGPTTAVAATGIDMAPAGVNDIFYVIEFDSSQFTNGYSFLRLQISAAGGANLISAVAILSGARHAVYGSPTVLT